MSNALRRTSYKYLFSMCNDIRGFEKVCLVCFCRKVSVVNKCYMNCAVQKRSYQTKSTLIFVAKKNEFAGNTK